MRVNKYKGKSNCIACGTEMLYKQAGKKYCSTLCRELYNRPQSRKKITLPRIPSHLIIEEKRIRWGSI
tara:strand:+ start:1576 stop:1779 length:204 start_codon:yes stop_codon:yes gene_type:complete